MRTPIALVHGLLFASFAALLSALLAPTSLAQVPTAHLYDVPYATGHPDQVMDWYTPTVPAPASPAIVFVHGGLGPGATPGDKENVIATIMLPAFLDAGMTVFSINHRPYPQFLHPAQLDDVASAMRHVRTNAAAYGIDPDQVMLWGVSSGAVLSGILAYGPEVLDPSLPPAGQPSSRPQAYINIVGLTDFFLMSPGFPGSFLGVDTLGDATFQQLADVSATWLVENVARPFTPPVVSLYSGATGTPPLNNPHDPLMGETLHAALAAVDPAAAARSLMVLQTGVGGTWYQTLSAWGVRESGLGPAAPLGGGVPGTGDVEPALAVQGDATSGGVVTLDAQSSLPGPHFVTLVVGTSMLNAPFKGGKMMPAPDLLFVLPTDASGAVHLPAALPQGLPKGFGFGLQLWLPDPGAYAGVAGSPGLFLLVM